MGIFVWPEERLNGGLPRFPLPSTQNETVTPKAQGDCHLEGWMEYAGHRLRWWPAAKGVTEVTVTASPPPLL